MIDMPFDFRIEPAEIFLANSWEYQLSHRLEEHHKHYQHYALWMWKYNFSLEDLFGYSLSDLPYIEYKFIKLNKN